VASLEIKTADELTALDVEGRGRTRRAGRETSASKRILRIFLDRGGPIPVDEIVAAFQDGPGEAIHQALVALDNDDLIRIRTGQIGIAYPFSASPTPFVVRLPGGKERYACCAMDALGIAPMVGQRVEIRSRCHHCKTPLEFSVSPDGPGPEAAGVMLWLGKRTDEQCKVADSL
jgi:alkylmercury lyase-like protein